MSPRAGNGGTGEKLARCSVGSLRTLTSIYNIHSGGFYSLHEYVRKEREESKSTRIITGHSLSFRVAHVPISAPGASWCALGIQLRESASDGERKVVRISHGCGRGTRAPAPI